MKVEDQTINVTTSILGILMDRVVVTVTNQWFCRKIVTGGGGAGLSD